MNQSDEAVAREVVDKAIDYGMGAPWPDRPPQNPLPICEQDLKDRILDALSAKTKEIERLNKMLLDIGYEAAFPKDIDFVDEDGTERTLTWITGDGPEYNSPSYWGVTEAHPKISAIKSELSEVGKALKELDEGFAKALKNKPNTLEKIGLNIVRSITLTALSRPLMKEVMK